MKRCFFAAVLSAGLIQTVFANPHAGFYLGKIGIHPDSIVAAMVTNDGWVEGIIWEPIAEIADTVTLYDSVYTYHSFTVSADGVILDSECQCYPGENKVIGSVTDGVFSVSLEGYSVTGQKQPDQGPHIDIAGHYMSYWEGESIIRRSEAIVFPDGAIHLLIRSNILFGPDGGYAVGVVAEDGSFSATGSQGYIYSGSINRPQLSLSIAAYGVTYTRTLVQNYRSPSLTQGNPFERLWWQEGPSDGVWYRYFKGSYLDDSHFPWVEFYGRGWAYCGSSELSNLWLMFTPYGWCWTAEYNAWPWMYSVDVGWIWSDEQTWPWVWSANLGWTWSDDTYWPWVWSENEGWFDPQP